MFSCQFYTKVSFFRYGDFTIEASLYSSSLRNFLYPSSLRLLRTHFPVAPAASTPVRGLATLKTSSSSLNDSNPNCSNRRPQMECDFKHWRHWRVMIEKPEGDLTRDKIIDTYIKTLAQVVGRITRCYLGAPRISCEC